ncbi:nuclear transport factor 2-like isoform X2 [Phragmites australis]|uniref:nuclear transport factor 2-like isoform X2 n=1 Tax=Phragmites australis TaxID=29695 RepID=UPI002D796E65|nr:nuclear transport factor 2-like isoform X2 [Phragmites australis]
MEQEQEQEIAGHQYALQVGSYFLTGYYNVLANQPHLAIQFYTDNSSVVRLDCETGQWSFGETVEVINDMLMSMNIHKIEVKTANFLKSWGAAITLLVTGLVQLKGYPARKRFVQTILLAPKQDGYFVFSDIFKLICDEYDDQYHVANYSCADNMPQVDAPYTMAETASDCLAGELEATEVVAPAENHEVQQQDPLEFTDGTYDDTPLEEHISLFPSSTDVKQDSPLAPPHPPSPPMLEEEPVEEAPKTYASVLRKKGHTGHQAIHSAPLNKAMMGTAESQQAVQLAQQSQSVPVREKINLDTNRVVSVPEDEEFLSVYVGNLSPSTSVFDLEKAFQTFGRIKPDGVAIRSRKEAGVFFGFVEFENMSGIQNALNASPIELNGRLVHVEERRPNSGFPRGGRRGRGRTTDFSRDQDGGRYDGEYATRSKGNGHQKKGGRQYDSYY